MALAIRQTDAAEATWRACVAFAESADARRMATALPNEPLVANVYAQAVFGVFVPPSANGSSKWQEVRANPMATLAGLREVVDKKR